MGFGDGAPAGREYPDNWSQSVYCFMEDGAVGFPSRCRDDAGRIFLNQL